MRLERNAQVKASSNVRIPDDITAGSLGRQAPQQGIWQLRKQYYFRPSRRGYSAWDVDRLVELTKDLGRQSVRLDSISEIDEDYCFGENKDKQTCRSIVEHMRLIDEADLSFPIILSSEGRVMDGMHRVVKALLKGRNTIEAVKFMQAPEPDYKDVYPEDLPY